MTAKNNKKNPVWLETRWEKRKKATVTRVKNAIQALVKQGSPVSFRRICDKVREQTGHPLSPTTIKQNTAAYELYRQHATCKPSFKLKDPALLQLLKEYPEPERPALKAKIARLKQITKEDLIARLIKLEWELKESKTIENKLRDRVFELEMFIHKNKKD